MSDFDKEIVLEILSQIQKSARIILRRFEPIQSAEDFTGSDNLQPNCPTQGHL